MVMEHQNIQYYYQGFISAYYPWNVSNRKDYWNGLHITVIQWVRPRPKQWRHISNGQASRGGSLQPGSGSSVRLGIPLILEMFIFTPIDGSLLMVSLSSGIFLIFDKFILSPVKGFLDENTQNLSSLFFPVTYQ